MEELLNETSLWIIGPSLFAALVVATELGYRGHKWQLKRSTRDPSSSSQSSSAILGAALGLLALILGFSFSMALDRYDQRRHLILEEANAIGTLDLRARLIEPEGRAVISDLMPEYVAARLEYFTAVGDAAQAETARQHTNMLQEKLWNALRTEIKPLITQQELPFLAEAMNETFDLASSRRQAFQAHIPVSVMEMVALYALICACILGYALAESGRRHPTMSSLLLLLLASVIVLIIDVDRPRTGSVVVSVAPLEELRDTMIKRSRP